MRHLVFTLAGGRWALPASDIGAVGEARALRRVPRAPDGVLGVAEWRGGVVTVLDAARLLGDSPGPGTPSLVRLGAPREHTALWIAGPITLAADPLDGDVRPVPPAALAGTPREP